jgi:hypothetical protein
VEVEFHAFLTLTVGAREWSASCPGCFTPRESAPGTHWIGGWVGPRASLDVVVKRKTPRPCQDSNHKVTNMYYVFNIFYFINHTGLLQSATSNIYLPLNISATVSQKPLQVPVSKVYLDGGISRNSSADFLAVVLLNSGSEFFWCGFQSVQCIHATVQKYIIMWLHSRLNKITQLI